MSKKKNLDNEKKPEVQMTFSEKQDEKDVNKSKVSNRHILNSTDAKSELIRLGKSVIEDIYKGRSPKIELSVRGLSNVKYDKESKTLQ
ncbi:TPA: hypothetical protein ENS27_01480, partial [bacterium]|nr:hypothetical protein [bacterium]